MEYMGEKLQMKKIVILGATGMLGSAVNEHFKKTNNTIISSYRTSGLLDQKNSFYFDAISSKFDEIPDCDYLLNCIGIIKPFMKENLADSIYINSVFPHKLSQYCKEKSIKLIHITTDCVFSGKDGQYHEDSIHDCEDEYGKSKSLGEPKDCMVIRTSIIGEEIHKNASLIEWIKNNKGKTINGFTEHFWNGVTTKHYAEICEQIIDEDLYTQGLFHVHSNDINKLELLQYVNDSFDLGININPMKTKKVDRTLRSNKSLLSSLTVKTLKQQIEEL